MDFADVTKNRSVQGAPYDGLHFGDLDNDGWLDFYVGTGDPILPRSSQSHVRNDGGKRSGCDDLRRIRELQKGHGSLSATSTMTATQDIYSVVAGRRSRQLPQQLFAIPVTAITGSN